MERAGKQSVLLQRLYQAELAKDPASRATESSRSNLIALRHTIGQITEKPTLRRLTLERTGFPNSLIVLRALPGRRDDELTINLVF